MNTIRCATCKYVENDRCNHPKRKTYNIPCLSVIPMIRRDGFIHPKYPNYVRPHGGYEYKLWEPKEINKEYLLTDKDFEI